jgi:hypothetical protein
MSNFPLFGTLYDAADLIWGDEEGAVERARCQVVEDYLAVDRDEFGNAISIDPADLRSPDLTCVDPNAVVEDEPAATATEDERAVEPLLFDDPDLDDAGVCETSGVDPDSWDGDDPAGMCDPLEAAYGHWAR